MDLIHDHNNYVLYTRHISVYSPLTIRKIRENRLNTLVLTVGLFCVNASKRNKMPGYCQQKNLNDEKLLTVGGKHFIITNVYKIDHFFHLSIKVVNRTSESGVVYLLCFSTNWTLSFAPHE